MHTFVKCHPSCHLDCPRRREIAAVPVTRVGTTSTPVRALLTRSGLRGMRSERLGDPDCSAGPGGISPCPNGSRRGRRQGLLGTAGGRRVPSGAGTRCGTANPVRPHGNSPSPCERRRSLSPGYAPTGPDAARRDLMERDRCRGRSLCSPAGRAPSLPRPRSGCGSGSLLARASPAPPARKCPPPAPGSEGRACAPAAFLPGDAAAAAGAAPPPAGGPSAAPRDRKSVV